MAMRLPLDKMKGRNAYAITYDSSDHLKVLTRLSGSIWPKVLPYCIFNTAVMITVITLRNTDIVDLGISNMGHVYVGVVVSFLLVSRVSMAYTRYSESRNYLSILFRSVRELVSTMAAITAPQPTSTTSNPTPTTSSQLWRYEIAYRSIILLRTTMAVIDYPTDFIPSWDVPELSGEEKSDILLHTYLNPDVAQMRVEELSEFEECMRVPIRISYLLRKSIHSHWTRLTPNPMHIVSETKLLSYVDQYMTGYYGIRKFLTTPVPFPMIQMSRTFVFAYVFTIPFSFLSDTVLSAVYHCIAVFVITFGFLGLELCAIELDNPFGDDENDLKNLAFAHTCMADVYLTILDVDGLEYAEKLRKRILLDDRRRSKAERKLTANNTIHEMTSLLV